MVIIIEYWSHDVLMHYVNDVIAAYTVHVSLPAINFIQNVLKN